MSSMNDKNIDFTSLKTFFNSPVSNIKTIGDLMKHDLIFMSSFVLVNLFF